MNSQKCTNYEYADAAKLQERFQPRLTKQENDN